jgi:hypothetical protein
MAGVSMTGRAGAPSARWGPTSSANARVGGSDSAGVTSSTAKVMAMAHSSWAGGRAFPNMPC